MRRTNTVSKPKRANRFAPKLRTYHWSSRMTRRGGFSLVEMVMVMTIISLAAAIAVPRFAGSINRRNADSAARRVIQDLMLARQHARVTSSDIKITFLHAPGYQMDNVPDPNNPNNSYSVNLKGAPYNVSQWEVDFAGTKELSFDMHARANRQGTIVIRVGEELRTITVNPETGIAKLSDGEDVSTVGFEVSEVSKVSKVSK